MKDLEYYHDHDECLFKDASFKIHPSLAKLKETDSKEVNFVGISFESVNYTNHFLKYDGQSRFVVVEKLKQNKEDNSLATWIFENGTYYVSDLGSILVRILEYETLSVRKVTRLRYHWDSLKNLESIQWQHWTTMSMTGILNKHKVIKTTRKLQNLI